MLVCVAFCVVVAKVYGLYIIISNKLEFENTKTLVNGMKMMQDY